MKKSTLLLIMLFIYTTTIVAQIQVPKKITKNIVVNPGTVKKLPVLTAKSVHKDQGFSIEKARKAAFKTKLLPFVAEAAPMPYSTVPYALNTTLTPEKLKTSDAHLIFFGSYSGNAIKISRGSLGGIRAILKAKRNKTYRVILKFEIDYKKECQKKLTLAFLYDQNIKTIVSIKKGTNTLDFLVKSEVDGEITIPGFEMWAMQCGEKLPPETMSLVFDFKSMKIRELQD